MHTGKQVIYWSGRFNEREKAEKKSFFDFIEKVRQSLQTLKSLPFIQKVKKNVNLWEMDFQPTESRQL